MKKQQPETWNSGDPAHKKLMAYGIVAVFIGVIAVLGVRSVSGPQLFAGDKQESLVCRLCGGRPGVERCKLCLSTGNVKVIIPGPNHPIELRGTVRDSAAFSSPEAAQAVADKEAVEVTLKPVQVAVQNARLVFEKDGKKINIEGKATGRFRCNLPPGNYQLSIQAQGYQSLNQAYVVPVRTQPVWPSRPGLDMDNERLRPVFLMTR